ncbi:MAG: hypothetical protein HDQ88_09010 [Clostridia bacterium]|nr:hypothetical protein [Clostridia bacterium]
MSVNLYDPKTLQGSVWNEKDVERKRAEGFLTEDEYKAIKAEEAAEAHEKWLTSPGTEEERFQMLRSARDAKLTEYDTKIAQLTRRAREGEDMESELDAWDAYATALCNLPEQKGAPWDGGGELTPWPTKPE